MKALATHIYSTLLIFFICITTAHAQVSYPTAEDLYINDYANIINLFDKNSIQERLRDVYSQTGIEIVVVTINSTAAYNNKKSFEFYATSLFNLWGVGRMPSNNGVMILVSKDERKVRIELGASYSDSYNAKMKKIIDKTMLPHFKSGNYSKGIDKGTQAVIDSITVPATWLDRHLFDLVIISLIVLSVAAGISCLRTGKKGWGYVFFTIAIMLLLALLKKKAGSNRKGFGGGNSRGGGASGSW